MKILSLGSWVLGLGSSLVLVSGCVSIAPAPVVAPVPAPPMPVSAMAEKMQAAVERTALVAPARSNAVIAVAWDKSLSPSIMSYRIYSANNTYLFNVDAAYNNFTLRGLRNGDVYAFYATALDDAGMESDPSNVAMGIATEVTPWTTPYEQTYARTFTWKCANRITNILQSSDNLFLWTTSSRFRGTNGTAVVTLTNQTAFHRVLVQNATNVPPMTLTQQTAFVQLTWSKGTRLEREADARTGSFIPVLTNNGSAVLPFIAGAKYRVLE